MLHAERYTELKADAVHAVEDQWHGACGDCSDVELAVHAMRLLMPKYPDASECELCGAIGLAIAGKPEIEPDVELAMLSGCRLANATTNHINRILEAFPGSDLDQAIALLNVLDVLDDAPRATIDDMLAIAIENEKPRS